MHTEIEAKFLDINKDNLRAKLKAAGAKCLAPERTMQRMNFDFPDMRLARERSGWVRVRDEGDSITMSYKQTNDYTLHGTKEINLTVDSYEAAIEFVQNIGLKAKNHQVTKRESWLLDGVQIEIDTWPWIPSFVELEGESEAAVQQAAKQLGLDWAEAVFGDVMPVYQRYYDLTSEEVYAIAEIDFTEVPEWLATKHHKGKS